MTQQIIYPNGTKTVLVQIGEYLKIGSYEGKCDIYSAISKANFPIMYTFLQTIENEELTLGTYSTLMSFQITARAGKVYFDSGATPTISVAVPGTLTATDELNLDGENDTQGGDVNITGGTSSTSANAGGAVVITGGTGGATGIGGALTAKSGAGNASAAAVAATAGGVATFGSGIGGANTGGATGQAGGAGGALNIIAGAGGATNSTGAHAGGAGGDLAITAGAGGAATAGTGNGGAGGTITITPGTGGATTGGTAGIDGVIIARGVLLVKQDAAAAKTTSATLTAAELLVGEITVNQGGGANSALQLPLATAVDTALPDSAAGDAFDFSVINISTVAAETASVTTNTGWTLVGNMLLAANTAVTDNSQGIFRAKKTGAGTWTLTRRA